MTFQQRTKRLFELRESVSSESHRLPHWAAVTVCSLLRHFDLFAASPERGLRNERKNASRLSHGTGSAAPLGWRD